jgi:hypothetical protein
MEDILILKIKPDKYLFNGSTNCGVYLIKGILSAYNKDKYLDPLDYHLSSLARFFGWTLTRSLKNILKNFGIKAEIKFAHGNTEQIIELLKFILQTGNPIILNIGSCYDVKDRWIAKIIPHWITVWGYDREHFFVYDSSVPLEKQNQFIPIGNRKIEHQDLVWFWGAAYWFYVRGIFYSRYKYLTVKNT